MITALSTPASGFFMLDANNTKISIQSTNGAGYYFRARIYVNGTLFDTQSWSRTDAFTATKDLKFLYSAYYEPQFTADFVNLLEERTHLYRQVYIAITEYEVATGNIAATLNLPVFFLMYNIKPVEFYDVPGVQFLGMHAPVMVLPATGKIAFPVYVSADTEDLVVTVATNSDTVINQQIIPAIKGKHVYLYQFDVAGAALSYNVLYLTATVQLGAHPPITINYRINRLPSYPCQELVYQNNFGFYVYAYPSGEMQLQNGFEPAVYATEDGSQRVYEIPEEATYTINSGSLNDQEKNVLNMIANSLDTRLRNGSEWLRLVTKIKKQLEYKSRQHAYDEALQFTVNKGADVPNIGMVAIGAQLADIFITNVVIDGRRGTIYFELNNGFTPVAGGVEIQLKTPESTVWDYVLSPSGAVVSPMSFSFNLRGVYQLRMRATGDNNNVSNVKNIILT